MTSDADIRQRLDFHVREASKLRKQLREHKRKNVLGLPSSKKISRTVVRRDGHTYIFLEGWKDKLTMRLKIYANAGGEAILFDDIVEDIRPATCQGCAEPHLISWNEGEWFHNSKSKGGRRCDGACCALFTCKPFHVRWHNRVIGIKQVKS